MAFFRHQSLTAFRISKRFSNLVARGRAHSGEITPEFYNRESDADELTSVPENILISLPT